MGDEKGLILISAVVEHKPGVLHRISNMFRRRDFNIESISVGVTEFKDLARMTITVKGDEKIADQVVKQMSKLIDVIHVEALNWGNSVQRELALIKLKAETHEKRSEIMDYTSVFRGRIIDVARESLIVEITGDSEKINAFINLTKQFGIIEVARTGITALARGPSSIGEEVKKNLNER
ncbi:MAG: acetolactate synthase small subunit [Candidatus Bathyarchaeia archaeon]